MKTIIFIELNKNMKNTAKHTLNEMKRFASKMPKTVNEMINLGENEMEMEMPSQEMDSEMPQHEMHSESGMDVEAFVDDIRKKALKGMAQLADNPEDSRYQILKKIWQICDKKPEEQAKPAM